MVVLLTKFDSQASSCVPNLAEPKIAAKCCSGLTWPVAADSQRQCFGLQPCQWVALDMVVLLTKVAQVLRIQLQTIQLSMSRPSQKVCCVPILFLRELCTMKRAFCDAHL